MQFREIPGRVKDHVKEHKSEYIVGTVCLFVGAAGATVLVVNKPEVAAVQKVTGLVNWKPSQTIIQQSVMALGHPGFKIVNNRTGEEYQSINALAKALKMSSSKVAQHLHGKIPELNGETFSIIGLSDTSHFPVPEAA